MKIEGLNNSATQLLLDEANQILQLLGNQSTICLACPIYEEIKDTKMYGFSEKVKFAIALELIDEEEGQLLLSHLEHQISNIQDDVFKK